MTNTTLNVNLNNLTEEERNSLLALIEKANKPEHKVWKPKENEVYYYIREHVVSTPISSDHWKYDDFDKTKYALGNCFRTKEEAEFALEKQKVHTELKRFAHEHNETEINWNDTYQNKYHLYYNSHIDVDYYCTVKFANTVYFTSEEIAKQAIETIGEDRLKKYYFEVK